MYAPAQTRASRPASTSSTVFPNSQYPYAAQFGTEFAYDIYPPFLIPKSSSSSLAAALDPAPEFNKIRTPEPPSQLAGRADEQLNRRSLAPQCAASSPSAEGVTVQINMSNQPVKPYDRQFPDDIGSLRSQHQMYQAPDPQRHALNQPQSSSHFAYEPPHAPTASSSTSYIPPHQQAAYMQTNDPRWPTEVGLQDFPDNFPLAPETLGVAPPSQIFDGYAFGTTCVSEGGLDVYGPSGGVGWTYMQGNPSFQASEGIYPSFSEASTSANASAGPWAGSSFNSDSGPNPSFTNSSAFTYPASGPETNSRQSSDGSSASTVDNGYFDECQEAGRRHRQQLDKSNSTTTHNQYRIVPQVPQAHDERRRESLHTGSRQTGSSTLQSALHAVQSGPSALQSVSDEQGHGQPQQHRGHNTLMPPPPLPARAHTLGSERHRSETGPSQTVPARRHTFAAPPVRKVLSQDEDASAASSLATGSVRPSSAAPESTSSSSLHDESANEGSATPRLATLSLNDAMWAQAGECNRSALLESFRLVHGSRDPPVEMHIRRTSALERSRTGIGLLKPNEERAKEAKQLDHVVRDSSSQSLHGSPGTELASGTGAQEEMSDEELFICPPGGDWVPARSGYEIEQAAASQESLTNPVSLVSPISSSATDELVTPGDASALPAIRKAQTPYAYVSPAKPDNIDARPSDVLMRNVLSVIRHDGHLPQHISGLGGCFQNAYDGRSYLTDDSEQDPEHVPRAPPGARSGDHPVLSSFLPHPLAKRGQNWHELINPAPKPLSSKNGPEQGGEGVCDKLDQTQDTEEEEASKKLENEGIKKEEEGEGWGFVEAGSHGPLFALPGVIKAGGKHNQRLKLSTEKKTPPKMACHFCRNRKIACGPSKCGDKTICNQCERRNIRCIFPTVSRRGMRTRNPRSAHTVDGTDEADKDSLECDESSGNMEAHHNSTEELSSTGVPKKSGKTKRQSEKSTKDKDATKGRGRGKGKRKADTSEERTEDVSRLRGSDDIEMDGDAPGDASGIQVDQLAGYTDDPLASIAAEMHWSAHDSQPLPSPSSVQFDTSSTTIFPAPSSSSTSSLSAALHFASSSFEVSFPATTSSDTYASHIGSSAGPFTTNPLQRRNQGNTGSESSSHP